MEPAQICLDLKIIVILVPLDMFSVNSDHLSCIFLSVFKWHHYNLSSAKYYFLQLCRVFVIDRLSF